MRNLTFGVALMLAVGSMVGCAATTENGETADNGAADEQALSSTSASLVTLRRDTRRCVSPACGGYWAHPVNSNASADKDQYVSSIDFSAAGMSVAAIEAAREGIALGTVILKGKLGTEEKKYHTRPLIVTEAYRGMPGVKAKASDIAYQVHERTPHVMCVVAPCPNEVAVKVNSKSQKNFADLSVEAAALAFVDQQWLSSRVLDHDAIVVGHVVESSKALVASQVYIKLPDNVGPCPMRPEMACGAGKMSSSERNADRCIVQTACVTPGACRELMPACAAGYKLQTWHGGDHACPEYACDPDFLFGGE